MIQVFAVTSLKVFKVDALVNCLQLHFFFFSDASGRRWACLNHIVEYVWEKIIRSPRLDIVGR